MLSIDFGRRRLLMILVALGSVILLYNISFFSNKPSRENVPQVPIPDRPAKPPTLSDLPPTKWEEDDLPAPEVGEKPAPPKVPDSHPITALMKDADAKWREYESSRSKSFRQAVEKYRSTYGRHPPPGFKEWYQFAMKKNVFNIDDFDQIMDDLRPFWAIDPKIIRAHAAHMWENREHGIAALHIRNKRVAKIHPAEGWRIENFEKLVKKIVKYLPDMDIAMNVLDQPRVAVPWEDMQELLAKEYETRSMPPDASDSFTASQDSLLDLSIKEGQGDESLRLDAEWFNAPGRQYMEIASKACPPESPARLATNPQAVDLLYKEPLGGIVKNFNLSSDLCTVGPAIQDLHGMLYSASSITASYKLVPVFSECKVNVNSDILFPANMYYMHDKRYDYSDAEDLPWEEKSDSIIWRGVTSGGVQIAENWSTMHRQRLVQLLNGTYMKQEGRDASILVVNMENLHQDQGNVRYEKYSSFRPTDFADEHTDVGFVESWGCVPNCSFYDTVFSWKPQTTLTSQFRSKYLMDVDGHSFSGRWHAFLQSKSLGFKATIFREWHDSRLFAWHHFVPVDNRYDDLYSLLTYFIGIEKPDAEVADESVFVPSHEFEAQKIAKQSRDWANKVLRRDDIEVYMLRLLLEYGRIIDDNRDLIGYSGDGSELDKFDEDKDSSGSMWGLDKIWDGFKKTPTPNGDATAGETEGSADRSELGESGQVDDWESE